MIRVEIIITECVCVRACFVSFSSSSGLIQ